MTWVVVERYVLDGYSYQVMRRPFCNWPRLSKRERQVLDLLLEGHSNKRIAQELDVSPSTVGVLIFRATVKLKINRENLLTAYRKLLEGAP